MPATLWPILLFAALVVGGWLLRAVVDSDRPARREQVLSSPFPPPPPRSPEARLLVPIGKRSRRYSDEALSAGCLPSVGMLLFGLQIAGSVAILGFVGGALLSPYSDNETIHEAHVLLAAVVGYWLSAGPASTLALAARRDLDRD